MIVFGLVATSRSKNLYKQVKRTKLQAMRVLSRCRFVVQYRVAPLKIDNTTQVLIAPWNTGFRAVVEVKVYMSREV